VLNGDPDSLKNLFIILLDNALKYSPSGKKVSLLARQDSRLITVKVIDQGIGIAKEDLPHLFSRFYRADQSRSKNKVDGFGLGLSIAKKIVTKHHATISLDSKVNKGTTFTLNFPALK